MKQRTRIERKTLHLHLKYRYFDAIKRGEKQFEYRLASKWQDRLGSARYTHIRLYRGYQKASPETVIDAPYVGYILEVIKHEHFGPDPVWVCAIPITPNQPQEGESND